MNHQPNELRQAATQAFQESLDQLQETLKLEEGVAQPAEPTPTVKLRQSKPKPELSFDLETLEQAVADIEKFLEQKQAEPTDESGR